MKYEGQVAVVGVAGRDELDAIQGFIAERGVDSFPHISDQSGDVWASFGISSQPAFVFINDDGTIAATTGVLGESGIDQQVEALIAS